VPVIAAVAVRVVGTTEAAGAAVMTRVAREPEVVTADPARPHECPMGVAGAAGGDAERIVRLISKRPFGVIRRASC
jgi:hypothetical protein